MRAKLLVNDVHLGVQRSAGTTPKSAFALGQYLLDSFEALIMKHLDKDLYVLGDLFDEFDVPESYQLLAFVILSNWLELSAGVLALKRGNHDIAKDNSRTSSFEYLCRVLKKMYPERVIVVDEPMMVAPGHYFIPHLANQEMLNAAFDAVPSGSGYVYLHCNYDNDFAAESDHSLNIAAAQARAIVDKGWTIIIAHEHQARKFPGVRVLGNQCPSSIADCMNNPGNEKFAHVVHTDGRIEPIQTWKAEGTFVMIDWRAVETTDLSALQFVRVVGEATKDEAAKVLAIVSRLRQKSPAFVITNAVRYEGIGDMDELKKSAEDLKGIDVMDYLKEQLDADQIAAVAALLEKQDANVSG